MDGFRRLAYGLTRVLCLRGQQGVPEFRAFKTLRDSGEKGVRGSGNPKP